MKLNSFERALPFPTSCHINYVTTPGGWYKNFPKRLFKVETVTAKPTKWRFPQHSFTVSLTAIYHTCLVTMSNYHILTVSTQLAKPVSIYSHSYSASNLSAREANLLFGIEVQSRADSLSAQLFKWIVKNNI